MSRAHSRVPSVLAHELPRPVPEDELAACPADDVFQRLGDKWSMLPVILLSGRPHRYNDLHRAIEGTSRRMPTRTLRGLETDGLVVRREVHPTVPPAVEYSLTPLGRTLLEPLSAQADWAVPHEAEMNDARSGHIGVRGGRGNVMRSSAQVPYGNHPLPSSGGAGPGPQTIPVEHQPHS